jgi:hypothetical protein
MSTGTHIEVRSLQHVPMKNLPIKNRSVYRIKNTDLLIAISDNLLREIRECATEYQSLDKVPVYRTVKGIVFKMINKHLPELLHNGAEAEYAISSLDFNVGNLPLSA